MGQRWYWGETGKCRFWRFDTHAYYDLPGLIAHELFGHGAGMLRRAGKGEAYDEPRHTQRILGIENSFHRAPGQVLRCRY